MSTTSTSHSTSSTETPKRSRATLDGELRNREVTRTLLSLRGESLMHAVAAASRNPGVRLDYGNASAWMREIPGRFGQKKQEELLRYLGVDQHRLNPGQIHVWALPRTDDVARSRALLDLLNTYAEPPDRFIWLTTPSGALRGLAIKAGGVGIVFQPTAETNQNGMRQWLSLFQLRGEQEASAGTGVKTDEMWGQLIDNQSSPESLWLSAEPSAQADWKIVIDWAKQKGLGPIETKELLQAAWLKSQHNY